MNRDGAEQSTSGPSIAGVIPRSTGGRLEHRQWSAPPRRMAKYGMRVVPAFSERETVIDRRADRRLSPAYWLVPIRTSKTSGQSLPVR